MHSTQCLAYMSPNKTTEALEMSDCLCDLIIERHSSLNLPLCCHEFKREFASFLFAWWIFEVFGNHLTDLVSAVCREWLEETTTEISLAFWRHGDEYMYLRVIEG